MEVDDVMFADVIPKWLHSAGARQSDNTYNIVVTLSGKSAV